MCLVRDQGSIGAANAFLPRYLPRHNGRFAVADPMPGVARRPAGNRRARLL
jgi:hypothetical protein